jgi:hypothetical protein
MYQCLPLALISEHLGTTIVNKPQLCNYRKVHTSIKLNRLLTRFSPLGPHGMFGSAKTETRKIIPGTSYYTYKYTYFKCIQYSKEELKVRQSPISIVA